MGHTGTYNPKFHDELLARLLSLSGEGVKLDRLALTSFAADFSLRCEDPKWVLTKGAQEGASVSMQDDPENLPYWLEMQVGCRVCPPCLARRRALWAARALQEVRVHPRTWFVTLTCKPEVHYLHLEMARAYASRSGVEFSTLSDRQRFARRVNVLGHQLTKCVKRWRKNSCADLRYLFVFEAHKSGDPHIHGLVHEVNFTRHITKRELQGSWESLGFSLCKLVNREHNGAAAGYVCKYLAKDMRTRVRASIGYGSVSTEPMQDRLDEELSAVASQRGKTTTPLQFLYGTEEGGHTTGVRA